MTVVYTHDSCVLYTTLVLCIIHNSVVYNTQYLCISVVYNTQLVVYNTQLVVYYTQHLYTTVVYYTQHLVVYYTQPLYTTSCVHFWYPTTTVYNTQLDAAFIHNTNTQ